MKSNISVVATNSGGGPPPCPQGIYTGTISGVFGLGLQPNDFGEKPKRQVVVRIEVDKRIENHGDFYGMRYALWRFYSLSTHKKSKLFAEVKNIRGYSLTSEEQKSFDIHTLIGACFQVNVEHDDESGRAKIASIIKLPENATKLLPEASPDDIPDWIEDLRKKALPEDSEEDGAFAK